MLEDQSGLYADATGAGSTLAAQMAVEDSGLLQKGWKINVVSADHQNKADIGSSIARRWFDVENVDAIVGLGSSSVSLAVSQVAKDRNKTAVVTSGATSDLTGSACNANTVHWTYDTYALAKSTGTAVTKSGGDTWFFITADYAFGAALERDTTAAVVTAVPTMPQAGTYAGTLHYLKAVEALEGDTQDGSKVVAKMKELSKDDPLFGKGEVRADGRAIHPVYLFQAKAPADSKGPWDTLQAR